MQARGRATGDETLAFDTLDTMAIHSIDRELADTVVFPAAAETGAVARASSQRQPRHAEARSASNNGDMVLATTTPSARFIPLVKQAPGALPIPPLGRGDERLAAQEPATPSAWPARAIATPAQWAGSDAADDAAGGPRLAQRSVLPLAEPAAAHASGERADAPQAMAREPATVRVTIGRIEVRAGAAPARAEPPRKAPPPRRGITLDAYLKQRNDSRS